MGLLDKFKSKVTRIGRDKKPKHVVEAKKKADDEKRRQFAAVGSAADRAKPTVAKKPASGQSVESQPATKRRDQSGQAYRILLRAVVSEKSTSLGSHNQYVFVIANGANKIDVGQAIHALYGVRPQKVNIVNVAGKAQRYGRVSGRTKNWKKAVVTLQPGQALNVVGS
ncbi:MAG: 50S ribosomal protein L23 [Candidatus Kerfeldbacteria bacterium]|nr:50S ribosomal protein L23 [Candidatus Kerfeldbacteria bacterium]